MISRSVSGGPEGSGERGQTAPAAARQSLCSFLVDYTSIRSPCKHEILFFFILLETLKFTSLSTGSISTYISEIIELTN